MIKMTILILCLIVAFICFSCIYSSMPSFSVTIKNKTSIPDSSIKIINKVSIDGEQFFNSLWTRSRGAKDLAEDERTFYLEEGRIETIKLNAFSFFPNKEAYGTLEFYEKSSNSFLTMVSYRRNGRFFDMDLTKNFSVMKKLQCFSLKILSH